MSTFFNYNIFFDVTNIVVSYKVFEKPLGLYNELYNKVFFKHLVTDYDVLSETHKS